MIGNRVCRCIVLLLPQLRESIEPSSPSKPLFDESWNFYAVFNESPSLPSDLSRLAHSVSPERFLPSALDEPASNWQVLSNEVHPHLNLLSQSSAPPPNVNFLLYEDGQPDEGRARKRIREHLAQGKHNPMPLHPSPPIYSDLVQPNHLPYLGPFPPSTATSSHSTPPITEFETRYSNLHPETSSTDFQPTQNPSTILSRYYHMTNREFQQANLNQNRINHQQDQFSHFNPEHAVGDARASIRHTSDQNIIESSSGREIQSNVPNLESFFCPETLLFSARHVSTSHTFHYKLIDFEPSSIDGKLVIEALNHLKLSGGVQFFRRSEIEIGLQDPRKQNRPKLARELFCLYSSPEKNGNEFFNFFSFSNAQSAKLAENTTRQSALERKSMWKRLLGPKNGPDYAESMFYNYKEFVLKSFLQSIKNLEQQTPQRLGDLKKDRKTRIFVKRAILIFPVYLFYVDLINAMIPAEGLDKAGSALGVQRKIAGNQFFKFIGDLMFDEKQMEDQKKLKKDDKRNLENYDDGIIFVWKAIYDWVLNSREELFNLSGKHPYQRFKFFFNCVVQSWFSDVTNASALST